MVSGNKLQFMYKGQIVTGGFLKETLPKNSKEYQKYLEEKRKLELRIWDLESDYRKIEEDLSDLQNELEELTNEWEKEEERLKW